MTEEKDEVSGALFDFYLSYGYTPEQIESALPEVRKKITAFNEAEDRKNKLKNEIIKIVDESGVKAIYSIRYDAITKVVSIS